MPIKHLAWLTDIHLNFVTNAQRTIFYDTIINSTAEAVVITGDIAEANNICSTLNELQKRINKPVYFILGNHDFHGDSVPNVKENIIACCKENTALHWLGKPDIISLSDDTLLIGQDGWADARLGDFENSKMNTSDSKLIKELIDARKISKSALKKQMQILADQDAKQLSLTLYEAIKKETKRVIIATHIPPFQEAHWHLGNPGDDDALPFFTSKVTGEVILSFAKAHQHISFLVLCGHTHTKHDYQASQNLLVRVGGAEYYHPTIQEIIKI